MTCQTKTGRSADGKQCKRDAHAILESRRGLFVLRGRRALLEALLRDAFATADDVRAAVELPTGISPKCFGAVPGPLVKAAIISADGFTKSSRPQSHARPVQRWRLADRAAAVAWLADNPDRFDPLPARDDDGPNLFNLAGNATPGIGAPGVC